MDCDKSDVTIHLQQRFNNYNYKSFTKRHLHYSGSNVIHGTRLQPVL